MDVNPAAVGQMWIGDDAALLRAFEPVVRLTRGETFLPVDVANYVASAAAWQRTAGADPVMVAGPGELNLANLDALGAGLAGPGLSLSVVNAGKRGRGPKKRRDRRQRLKGGSRLAEVGLLGRFIDSASRLSLLFRGSVPGGSAAGSARIQDDCLNPDVPTYFGRVFRDGGYIVCQYWFFYAFNNWRSGFGGVNEHEADWEQVTVYLDASGPVDGDGLPVARWVVFSAHDETGDDLRRRWDDPDLTLVGGRHPVVFAGAGSHSGAYLAGDYLITVEPPSLGGVVKVVRRVSRVLTPWSTGASGVGIPYVDYARGDGLSIGPSQEAVWNPIVIDEATPWVVGFRGLWGHDTRDRLGGERGPAGPKYERDGSVRASWADPVGWAGLSKVAPNPDLERGFVVARVGEIDSEVEALETRITAGRADLRTRSAGLAPASPEVRALAGAEDELLDLRLRSARLADERARLDVEIRTGTITADVHAHLRHRRTPIERADRARERLLGVWAILSTPLILSMLANIVAPQTPTRAISAIFGLAMLLSVEALARGYLLAFALRAIAVVAIGIAAYFAVVDWQFVASFALSATALLVLAVNLRDAIWR